MSGEGRGIAYESDGEIARITIDRPQAHNAFDDAMTEQLRDAWLRFEQGPERVAVISGGRSRHFSVGADLKNMPRDVWRAVPGVAVPVSKPVIAAIHGQCVGVGLALIQAADLCIADADARLLYAEPRVGLAYGLISGLAARIPHKFAMEVMLRGQPISAERAERMGLVNAVAQAGTSMDVALEFARDIAAAAPLVIRWLKHSVDAEVLEDGPTARALRTMNRVNEMLESHDFAEGRAAFAARRTPTFTGM
jgi:enoyl-CoA hydratase